VRKNAEFNGVVSLVCVLKERLKKEPPGREALRTKGVS
jgi:hypothetical protein